ncbi:MAG TPA: endolytic transglycosylase MltG [Amycolatopsis sp.]|nr:endolytic transglycosylase MltG [Amycolatopsis sp.]
MPPRRPRPPMPGRPQPERPQPPRAAQPPREPSSDQLTREQPTPPPPGRRARRRDGRPPAPPADEGLDLFDAPGHGPGAPPDDTPTEIIHFVDDDFDGEYPDDYQEDDYPDDYPDDYGDERAEPEYIEAAGEDAAPRRKSRKRRKPLRWVVALAVIGMIGGGAWFGIEKIFGYADYTGSGDADVIVQIGEGDSTNAIGAALVNDGVVASARAFVKASENNAKVLSLQPGYYLVKQKMSGAAAVAMLTGTDARVGELQVRAGTQLDDITQPDGSVTPGVFSLLSKASCANLNGTSTCVAADDLRKTAQTADLAAMGVPDWAVSAVAKSTDPHRIEGLVQPGLYDVKPGWSAEELLGFVLRSSATKLQAAGLADSSSYQGQNPYQLLIVASLIEKEGVTQDFGKISRVIFNRLAQNTRLQLDSTVNYLLDKPVVTTSTADRTKPGPYNTYMVTGLPPTPIGSPSAAAIEAALQPTDGAWMYFVKCEKNGLSCFGVTQTDQDHNIQIARQNGAY